MGAKPDADFYRAIAGKVGLAEKAFIDGKYRWSTSGQRMKVENPATGAFLLEIASCDGRDVDLAVEAARRAVDDGRWSGMKLEQRKSVLLRLAQLVEDNAIELAVIESIDSGKTITDCLHEVGTEVPRFFRWYAEFIDKIFGRIAPTDSDALALVVREPIGVVGLVLPWNFPLLMAAWKIAPALAAGCSVIVKPAEQTSLTALKLAQLASEAGLPDGVLNVLPGLGETAGQAIGLHQDIDAVSFTGSSEIGARFLNYASQSNLKSVGLELGGKSPFIVLDDAELTDDLINAGIQAAFWNAGQNCSANMRQIVSSKISEAYVDKVTERAKSIRLGDPLDPTTEMGAIVSLEQCERILSYVCKGNDEGARQLCGGRSASRNGGYFIDPVVFDAVTPDMTIAREEIFGPVLGVIAVADMGEAIRVASDTNYGLHASVFTKDIDRAYYAARKLACGTVSINAFSEGNVATPFGGYKRSGSLARDNGVEAFNQYVQTKTIWTALSVPT